MKSGIIWFGFIEAKFLDFFSKYCTGTCHITSYCTLQFCPVQQCIMPFNMLYCTRVTWNNLHRITACCILFIPPLFHHFRWISVLKKKGQNYIFFPLSFQKKETVTLKYYQRDGYRWHTTVGCLFIFINRQEFAQWLNLTF